MSFPYDASNINVDTSFPVAPEGIYSLVIKDTKEKTTKNGDSMVAVRCEIEDANEWLGTIVWHNVTFLPPEKKGAGMAVNFLKNIGEPWEGKITVSPTRWVGKQFRCKLKVSKDLQGRPRNEIAFILDSQENDEVPF